MSWKCLFCLSLLARICRSLKWLVFCLSWKYSRWAHYQSQGMRYHYLLKILRWSQKKLNFINLCFLYPISHLLLINHFYFKLDYHWIRLYSWLALNFILNWLWLISLVNAKIWDSLPHSKLIISPNFRWNQIIATIN